MRRVYLDHHSSAPPLREVLDALPGWLAEAGHPGAVHFEGRRAGQHVQRAREQVAGLLGVRAAEITFTSSGTEANNLALFGAALAARQAGRGAHLVALATEHDSVLGPMEALARAGMSITLVPVAADGGWTVDGVLAALTDETLMVSASLANYELGVVGPVVELGRALRERQVLLHTDACVAPGWLPLREAAAAADLLTLSGHKMGGIQGAGALYARRGVKLLPRLVGGVAERRRRAGTLSVAAVAAMGLAAARAGARTHEERERVAALRERLLQRLRAEWSPSLRLGRPDLPGCLAVSLPGLEGEALLLSLDLEGVAASSGAPCSSGSLEPSHVLRALGLPALVVRGGLRFTLGFETREEDVDLAVGALRKVVQRQAALGEERQL